jgi:methionyl-tRNA synthetase
MKKFYVTTAIPYVNAKPHIGHALEFVQADTIARFHKQKGYQTLLLSGGDENALKNLQAAEKAGYEVQKFIDINAKLFENLAASLDVNFDVFQKGSNKQTHFPSSQKLWLLCEKKGDIYKKSYEGLYCIGCEAFYTADELDPNGECFEHPGKKLDKISEENYFFRLSNYQEKLIKLISTNELKIIPQIRKNEMLSFLKQPLMDISISRSNERAKNWGVPVPNDKTQKIYVWFDALNIYQSGVGFGFDEDKYRKWWPADVHVIGKGITRFHAIYWPAFLLSAGLMLPKCLFVHGYFTINGQKMSKTLGNIIDPIDMIGKYGMDALRYYFLKEIPAYTDGDFSERRLKEIYNADLANGLGNLVSRVARLVQNAELTIKPTQNFNINNYQEYIKLMDEFRFNEAVEYIWKKITEQNIFIDLKQPWKLNGQTLETVLLESIERINEIAFLLKAIMPETSNKIADQFKGPNIKSQQPLFPRIT